MRRVCSLLTSWLLACSSAQAQSTMGPQPPPSETTSAAWEQPRGEARAEVAPAGSEAHLAPEVLQTNLDRERALAMRFASLRSRELQLTEQRRATPRRRRATLGFVFGGLGLGASYVSMIGFALAHADGRPPTPGERAVLFSALGVSAAAAIGGFTTAIMTLVCDPYRAEIRQSRRERRELQRELDQLQQARSSVQLLLLPTGASARVTF